jgi:two-component system, cell cycle sensor histidine kinase and response regulator CckA
MGKDSHTIADLERRLREVELEADRIARSKARADRYRQVLQTIRGMSRSSESHENRHQLIDQVCKGLTKIVGCRDAWAVLLGKDGKTVEAMAAHGFDGDGFADLKRRIKDDLFPESMMRVMDGNRIIVLPDSADQGSDGPVAEEDDRLVSLGCRLYQNGKTYGILVVRVALRFAHDPQEQSLLNDLADDLSFALYRMKITRRLHTSQRRYREMFKGSRDGFVMVDPAGRIIEANQAYCDMLGYTLDELCMKPNFYEITPERWRDWEAKEIWEKRLLGQGYSGLYEKEYIRKDGTVFPVELWSRVVRNEDGEIEYLWGTARDITDRKMMETKIKDSHDYLLTIFDSIDEPIYVADPETYEILFLNRAIQDVFGDPGPRRCFDFLQGRKDPCPFCTNDRIFVEYLGRSYVWEFRNESNGRWYRCIDKAIPWPDGRMVRYEMAIDITERIEAEKERENLQLQLSQIHKMESVGRLAGGVAHDFNNMLGVILGYAELAMEKTRPDDSLHADLEHIHGAARHSAEITKQLLAFTRKQTISPRLLDLNEVVEHTLKMLKRLIGEDVDLVWAPGSGLKPIKMDPSQVNQILTNLCVNARDAIGENGRITIETDQVSFSREYCLAHAGFIPGEYVMLAVSDDGCGIDSETLPHLFEPFFTTKDVENGTGLGLAMVYGIVRQNNGFINVYSEPGQGSTFKIYLSSQAGQPDSLKQEPIARPDNVHGTETVLLVEDEPVILNMARTMLERFGYRVLTAATPYEAIDLAKRHAREIHLMMTDLVMPQMNGRELAQEMSSINPDIKTLFMSGYTANVIAHHGVLDEGVHFIQKPFTLDNLAVKVKEVLDAD